MKVGLPLMSDAPETGHGAAPVNSTAGTTSEEFDSRPECALVPSLAPLNRFHGIPAHAVHGEGGQTLLGNGTCTRTRQCLHRACKTCMDGQNHFRTSHRLLRPIPGRMSRCAAARAGCVSHRPGVCAPTSSSRAGHRIGVPRRLECQGVRQPPYSRKPRLLHCRAGSEAGQQQARAIPPAAPASLAIFVSGGGSNFRAIQEACASGAIKARVVVVVTNAPHCGAAQYAESLGIPVLVYPSSKPAAGYSPDELVAALKEVTVGPA